MKYASLILALFLILAGCGKKTNPVPKSALADMTPPTAVFVSVDDAGIRIDNQESDQLFIEKGVSADDECSVFNFLKVIDPKSVFIDEDVQSGFKYFYRLRKRSVKYGVLSEPYMAKVVYAKPMKVQSAKYTKEGGIYRVSIETDDKFTRFDVYSGGKTIAQTGGKTITFPESSVVDNKFYLILSDYDGNRGTPYTIEIPVQKVLNPPLPVTTISVLNIGADTRIVWSDSEGAETYNVKACENVSCETFSTQNTSVAYQKTIKSCLDITVTAVNADGESAPTKIRYCKPEEE
ncbi:MAG: hypothetical protein AB7F25_06145 [Deferribacterales bacterium]